MKLKRGVDNFQATHSKVEETLVCFPNRTVPFRTPFLYVK